MGLFDLTLISLFIAITLSTAIGKEYPTISN